MKRNTSFTTCASLLLVAGVLVCSLARAVEPRQSNSHVDQKEFFKPELYISSSYEPLEKVLPLLSNQADPLMKLQREGWKIVQNGVLRRDLRINEVETFVFGEAGFSWKLRDLQAQLQVLRREFQAHPTPELRKAIASHRKMIASTLKLLERVRATDASEGTAVLKTGCTPTFSYHANASYKTDRPGTWADADAEFNVSTGCNSSGEVYAYAFVQTTVNGAPSTVAVTDGPRSGSNVNASADANIDGGSPCESYAYASVTSGSLSPTSYSISQTNNQCPAPAVWVSVDGNDTNDCSTASPCRTFSGALGKVSPGGQINILDSGDFGPVTIDKPVSLISNGALGGIHASAGTAITINAGANDKVVLRGLTLDGLGTGLDGVSFVAGGNLYIENCTINSFGRYGINFSPTSGSGKLFVTDTILRNNGVGATGGGLYLSANTAPGFVAVVDGLRSESNVFGVRADNLGSVTVRNSLAANNGFAGFTAVTLSGSGPIRMFIENSISVSNGTNGVASGGIGATVTISNVAVTNNQTGLIVGNGGVLISFGNNKIQGNTTDGAPTTTSSQQ